MRSSDRIISLVFAIDGLVIVLLRGYELPLVVTTIAAGLLLVVVLIDIHRSGPPADLLAEFERPYSVDEKTTILAELAEHDTIRMMGGYRLTSKGTREFVMHGSAKIIMKLADQLRRRGVNPRLQVRAGDRVMDIVTDTAIYEVRDPLTETALAATIPVIQTARAALGDTLNMVIVGSHPADDAPTAATLDAAKDAGITVNFWSDSSSQLH